MKARRGQVAIYLAVVLVAIAVLTLMNVNTYLAVTAKNKAMNAGDSAALAVARYQGELLDRIAKLNREHLTLLMPKRVESGTKRTIAERLQLAAELVDEQRRIAFIDPLRGISYGNNAAIKVGAKANAGMLKILQDHVDTVRNQYVNAIDIYPEPWEGAWQEYASVLEAEISSGIVAGPDNINFRNADGPSPLTNRSFYNAVAGRTWCWFNFNAKSLLENYQSYQDWPRPETDESGKANPNSEIYSLDLAEWQCAAHDLYNDSMIERITNRKMERPEGLFDPAEYEEDLLDEKSSVWFVYNTGSTWRNWWEIDPDGKWQFPVVGKVKAEYDVRGCAAICRVYEPIVDLLAEDQTVERYEAEWSAAAKPFGYENDADGQSVAIASQPGDIMVRPIAGDWDARLVPLDTVGGKDLSTADPKWVEHVQNHLPAYYDNGPGSLGGCWYCQQLKSWETESVRAEGRAFLKTRADTCERSTSGGTLKGGTAHGH